MAPEEVLEKSLKPELAVLMKEEIDKAREEKIPLSRAFEAIANRSGLKVNTVRSYYYRYLHKKDKNDRCETKTREEGDVQGVIGKPFTTEEVKKLIETMLRAQAEGISVRGCANRLSGGDPKLLIRFQNKYRNTIAKKREFVEKVMKEMKEKGISYYNPYTKECVRPENSEVSDNGFLNVLSALVSNIQRIDEKSLYPFFKGLKDLSDMALAGREKGLQEEIVHMQNELENYRSQLKEKECIIQELNDRIKLYEVKIEEQKNKITRLVSLFRQLISINQKFLGLPDVKKISELGDYAKQLETCVRGYEDTISEYGN